MTNFSEPQPNAVALIQESDRGLRALGAFTRFDLPFKGDAKPGDLFEITGKRTARPVRHIGRPSSARAVIEALALHHGELDYTPEQERAAERIAARPDRFERKDLRELATFTIDGETTKDFDDALSAQYEGRNIRVWVHVADVAAYVRPGDEIDTEAFRRATSHYLPTRTIAMLPKALSTGVCSLVEGEDRAAVTVELLLRNGKVIQRSFYRSLIRSDARLTYSHVEDIFLGRAEPGPTYAAALAAARQAAVDRTTEAAEHGTEAKFVFTGDEVTGIEYRPEEESQRLIERLMVLANQEVASFLAERGVPTLYRTHAVSEPERVQRMLARLDSLGVHVAEPTVQGAWDAVEDYELANGPNDALRGLLYGARPPAAYERELAAHEGLGADAYTHFTSPIRRYPDLIVHRALLAEIGAEEFTTAPRYTQLPAIAEHCNERARAAKKLERRAGDICRVSLLRYKLRETDLTREITGTISGMSEYGCYVTVDVTDGMLSGRELTGAANEQHTIWTTSDGRVLRLGETVEIKIRALDPVRGQLRLALDGQQPKRRGDAGKPRADDTSAKRRRAVSTPEQSAEVRPRGRRRSRRRAKA